MISSDIIRKYIPPSGGHTTLVIIDGVGTGIRVIPVDQSRIASIMRDFPPGSGGSCTGQLMMTGKTSGSRHRYSVLPDKTGDSSVMGEPDHRPFPVMPPGAGSCLPDTANPGRVYLKVR